MAQRFAYLAGRVAHLAGSYVVFLLAVCIVIVWAFTSPLFGFSDTGQLVINTGTTIVTFLMVFLIQNTQNRDAVALHLKLDELIQATDQADVTLMDAEEATESELARLRAHYHELVVQHIALKARLEEMSERADGQ